MRGTGLFPADRGPADGGLGAELAASLRLGTHFSLVFGGHAGRYSEVGSSINAFYDPVNGAPQLNCPSPCTMIPVTHESRDRYSLLGPTLSLRILPLTGRPAVPWIEVGAGPYRLSETSTDQGVRRDGVGLAFDFRRVDRGWGAGAHGGVGVDWFPRRGRVGITAAARLHGGLANVHSDLALVAALAVGLGVVIR